jgi:hypothetical protein
MLRLVSNENFNRDIVRGLVPRNPQLELVRVQDDGLMKTPDPEILAWAASQGGVLLSDDVSTVPPAAYQRVAMGSGCPRSLSCPTECQLARPDAGSLSLEWSVLWLRHTAYPRGNGGR